MQHTHKTRQTQRLNVKQLRDALGDNDPQVIALVNENRIKSEDDISLYVNQRHEIGKLVMCECKEDCDTRLFIRRFSYGDFESKRGWWSMFTVSDFPFTKGLHFCKIDRFRIDRNGNVNMVVHPFRFLGTAPNLRSFAWRALAYKDAVGEGPFSQTFCDIQFASAPQPEHRNNVENLRTRFSSDKHLFDEFIDGFITIEDIEAILDAPTNQELWMSSVQKKVLNGDKAFAEQYPLFARKYAEHRREMSLAQFISHNAGVYDRVFPDGSAMFMDDMDKTEAVLEWREEKKTNKRDARKQARLDAKLDKVIVA